MSAGTAFGPPHLKRLWRRARDAAGARYTHDLNVELPIARVFAGLGREEGFEQSFLEARDKLATAHVRVSDARGVKISPRERRRLRQLVSRVGTILADANALAAARAGYLPFDRFERRARVAFSTCRSLADIVNPPQSTAPDPSEPIMPRSEVLGSALHGLANALVEFRAFCASDEAACAEDGALLVVGDPGRGKTHLFCDVVAKRTTQGLVTVLLMGQHFESDVPVWRQIGNLLDVRGWEQDKILDCLEDRARRSGRRGLILIDALNEGGGLELWPRRLGAFLAALRKRRWLAVAVSCRTTYEPLVLTRATAKHMHRVDHLGFALREDEAVAQFFAHYELPLPRLPLLRAEYTVPLFLKLFCATLAEGRVTLPSLGHAGITKLYEDFCKGVGSKIARDLGNPPANRIPWDCAKAIAAALAQQRTESMPQGEVEQIVVTECGTKADPRQLYAAMVSEGLLAEDVELRAGVPIQVVRFPYQQFSHHLIARYLLKAHFNKDAAAQSFAPGTPLGDLGRDPRAARRNAGLLEALAVQLPERAPLELADLLGASGGDAVFAAAVQSITWRRVDAFPDRDAVVGHLNTASRRPSGGDDVLDAVVSVASVPDHPFGADFLHRNLVRRKLPVRDATWTMYLSRRWNASSVVDRLINWVEHHEQLDLTDQEARPLAILSTWFLTSSNRLLRDRATKVLVRLLQGRFALIAELLTLFAEVDDAYVLERLYTAAYGCSLLSDDRTAVAQLALHVQTIFFPRSRQPRSSHILMRDAARGIIDCALRLDPKVVGLDPKRFRPPYRSSWPLRAAPMDHLKERYGDEASTIYWSLANMGDFGRYVLERAVDDFTTRSLRRPPPHPTRRPSAKPDAALRLGGLDLEELLDEKIDSRDVTPADFDPNVLRSWVFQRVHQLGWTARRFGEFDARVNYGDMREARKEERIGKKYQWIGLHEGVGRIADHLWLREGWGDAAQYRACVGAWELGLRDIDPTLVLTTRPATEMATTWWQPYAPMLPRSTPAAQKRWVRDSRFRDLRRLVHPRDPSGRDWYVLEARYRWSEPSDASTGLDRDTARSMWLHIQGHIVPKRFLVAGLALVQQLGGNHDIPTSLELREVFAGEIGTHPAYDALTRMWERDEMLDSVLERPGERYIWSDGFDGSITDTVAGYVAGPILRRILRLPREPQPWASAVGATEVVDPSWQQAGPSVLLLRGDAMARLQAAHYAVLWSVRGEKNIVYGRLEAQDWRSLRGTLVCAGTEPVGWVTQRLEHAGKSTKSRGRTRR